MRKSLFFIAFISISLTGCNLLSKKKAVDLNNKLAGYTRQLENKGKMLGLAITDAAKTKDFSKVRQQAKGLQTYINDSYQEIDAMDNVEGSEELKTATKDFLLYERKLAEKGIAPFTEMGANTTLEEVQEALKNLMTNATEETTYLARIRKEQQAYAEKNGFKIETTP